MYRDIPNVFYRCQSTNHLMTFASLRRIWKRLTITLITQPSDWISRMAPVVLHRATRNVQDLTVGARPRSNHIHHAPSRSTRFLLLTQPSSTHCHPEPLISCLGICPNSSWSIPVPMLGVSEMLGRV